MVQKVYCPICKSYNIALFLSLGDQPPANDLKGSEISAKNCMRYDLSLWICNECLYVWLREQVSAEVLFLNNTYLTGVSDQTREDMQKFAEDCIRVCNVSIGSNVLDIASNDGTLLGFFKNQGCIVLGVDPSEPAYKTALARDISTINSMFNSEIAELILSSSGKMDLITATNIITHVPDPEKFLLNCKYILESKGSIVFEFYNFESMISNSAFDQIYHEHISYFNFTTFSKMIDNAGMKVYNVKQVNSQGGSLRVFVSFPETHTIDESVTAMLKIEGGIETIRLRYGQFTQRVNEVKNSILKFLKNEKALGNKIAGYGASAKSTVLLNFLKLSTNEVIAIADKSHIKQGKFIPGVAISVVSPEELINLYPDIIVIFAWNIRNEIAKYLKQIFPYRVRAITFFPKLSLVDIVPEA